MGTEIESFPIIYNTYGLEYKNFEKYFKISEKITDSGNNFFFKTKKVSLVVYFKHTFVITSTPYVIVITEKQGVSFSVITITKGVKVLSNGCLKKTTQLFP